VLSVYVIVAVPTVTPPDKTPVVEPIIATPGLLLIQVPPPEPVSVPVLPVQRVRLPVIAPGIGFTVITRVLTQPVLMVYVIVAVPAASPIATPELLPIVAIAG
jgi:hypothetical protein